MDKGKNIESKKNQKSKIEITFNESEIQKIEESWQGGLKEKLCNE